ncbi:MAG: hypothetical protein R3250_00155 [Melioribacteraceae bacterium]|nr:hypothetical protein [Melioribacteraceae bacterium]
MKVYMFYYINYEEFKIYGVFDSEEKAESAINDIMNNNIFLDGYNFEIDECEVNENLYFNS